MSRERIRWIDNEKGFVLLGVCLGHIGFSWNIFPYISTFHMAAFFFLSGMLFRPNREWREFLMSKCKSLLLPYVILSFFFLFLSPSLYQLSTHYPGSALQNRIADLLTQNDYIHSLLVQIQIYVLDIINGHSAPYVTPLWFVYTLFLLNILWFYPIRLISSRSYGSYWLGAIAILCFVAGWILYMRDINIPFNLPTCITSSAFFVGGFILGKALPDLSKIHLGWLVLMILILAGIYYYGVKNLTSPCIGYIVNDLDHNLLAYTSVSWCGTFLLTLLFICIGRLNKPLFIGRILRLISLNGIAILALHNYILSTMRWLAEIFNRPILANGWGMLGAIILFCIITLPLINRYLYICVGKKKPQST